jgi:hypothetical protein
MCYLSINKVQNLNVHSMLDLLGCLKFPVQSLWWEKLLCGALQISGLIFAHVT